MENKPESTNELTFQAELLTAGKTATGIQVPDDVVSSLGSSKKPAVNVCINGYDYRSTVASMGGKFMIPVSAEVRKHANIAAGEVVKVTLTADTQPREVTIPADFGDALQANPEAESFFNNLSYSNKRRILLAVEGAKTVETRIRRIHKAVDDLADGKA